MKKQNTLRPRPEDIKYEPKSMRNPNIWMHSMQSYRTKKTTICELAILVAIVLFIAFIYSILT